MNAPAHSRFLSLLSEQDIPKRGLEGHSLSDVQLVQEGCPTIAQSVSACLCSYTGQR